MLSSCPLTLKNRVTKPLAILDAALADLSTVYILPMPRLLPRPALFLFGYVMSSLYLLEHTMWSHTNGENDRDVDAEVFRRWVVEGGLTGAVEDVKRARGYGNDRVKADLGVVYGVSSKAKL